RLVFTTQPGGAQAGSPFATQPQVVAKDANKNTATSFTGAVTLAIKAGTGTAGAQLTGDTTVTAVAGVATFTGLRIDQAGTGYVVTASGGGASSDSAPFDV